VEGDPDVTYDYYWAGYQVVEVRKDEDTDPYEQVVWGRRYVHSPVCRWFDADTDGQNVVQHYYANDANFNITALVAADGTVAERYTYDPYGTRTIHDDDWSDEVPWANSEKNEILFTGHRLDPETGLYYCLARHYHPALGRWMQRDPIGYADGANVYQYVRSNPVGRTDSRGTEATRPCCAKIEGTRTHLHATVEAKRGREVERIYAHPEDSDVVGLFYPRSSTSASIGVTEGCPSADNLCQWSATIYGSTGPDKDWTGWKFQLSAEARYSIVVTNLACESGRLRVTCSGTSIPPLSHYYCPSFGTYHVPEGESRRLKGTPWVDLTWNMPAEERHEGTAWIVLKVSCE